MHISLASTAVALAAASVTHAFTPCPILGPVFPQATGLCEAPIFKAALKNLTAALDTASASGLTPYGQLPSNLTSFSVAVFDASSSQLLFTYDHSAPTLSSTGTKKITKDTTFRIGSGSKLMTVYTFLIEAGAKYWNHPITEFVPALEAAARSCSSSKDPIDCFDWDDITLGALASHLAGVPRDYSAQGELLFSLASKGIKPGMVGLPDLPLSDYPQCGWNYTNACPEEPYLKGLVSRRPTYAPFTTPIYANSAFELLEFALENITGRPFDKMIESDLFKKLDMTHSSYYAPKDTKNSAIPYDVVTSGWAAQLENETPVGGYFSSVSDMAKMGQSILSATLLSPAKIRQWMKPATFTSNTRQGVGLPWEIWRATNLTDHVFDFYTKEGDVFSYSSMFALAPDFDIGFAVLAAGNKTTSTVEYVSDSIAQAVFPAIEQVMRAQAQANFAGTYKSNETDLASNITLVMQPGEPGLVVESWYSNGTNFLEALYLVEGRPVDVRMYPTGLNEKTGKNTERMSFRATFWPLDFSYDGGVFSTDCSAWETVDLLMYGEVGVDEFEFDLNNGKVVSVTPRALRASLEKVA